MLKVLELSELFEPNRIEINRNQSKSIEINRNQSNQNEPNRIEFRVRIKFESFSVDSVLKLSICFNMTKFEIFII
jgi:hypothetical protein